MSILENIRKEKVEWKSLSEIGNFYGGLVGKNKYDFIDGNAKFVNYKNVFFNLATNLNELETVKIGEDEKQRKLEKGDIIFTGSSENLEECGLSSVITEDTKEDIYLNSFCFFLRLENKNLLLPDFSKYLFRTNIIRKQIIKTASGVTRYNVSKELMKKIQIPIPSIETQTKIVEILDKFSYCITELQASLKLELELRTKQYEYYRDMLLSEEYLAKKTLELCGQGASVEIKSLGEVSSVNRGASPRPIKNYITDAPDAVAWIKIGDIKGNSKYVYQTKEKITIEGAKKSRLLKKGAFILSNSMSYGRPYILKIDGAIHDGWASISDYEKDLITDFLYYYLTTDKVSKYWKIKMNTSAVSNLNSEIIKSLSILIPPLKVQQHIVDILDKFNTLANDLKENLPCEIELRGKQYEYYREKLLTLKDRFISTIDLIKENSLILAFIVG